MIVDQEHCGICEATVDLTHAALASEALPLRADGGPVGPPGQTYGDPSADVPICTTDAVTYAASLPSLHT